MVIKYGSTGERTAARWQVEVAVAVLLAAVGGFVIYDSLKVGIGWGFEGPQSGFFPFYIGLILTGASLVTLVTNLIPAFQDQENFVEGKALRGVLAVVIPTIVFVVAVGWLGIYVSAALLIAFFMRIHGRYEIWRIAAVALGVTVALFFIFEVWFVMPLPKGPLEAALGY